MSGEEDSPAQEIIIIKRVSDGEHPHHGGAWKIAYADFMTAMMAFFLVMWLINSSDEKTLVQVAAYFNPLKLTDKSPMPKGVHAMHDPNGGQAPKPDEQNPAEKEHKKSKEKAADSHSEKEKEKEKKEHEAKKAKHDNSGAKEETLFSDPYGVLARLAGEADLTKNGSGEVQAGSGSAFRDPFDPAVLRQPESTAATKGGGKYASGRDTPPEAQAEDMAGKGSAQKSGGDTDDSTEEAAEGGKPGAVPSASGSAGPADKPLPPDATPAERERKMVEREITGLLNASGLASLPHVEVTATSEGLLVSLTDDLNFSMFDSSSAQPRPELVVAMEKVGKVLASRPGSLVVRGHTDSRAFRSKQYFDNWRLSTARAHMAYYMLVRGGVPENRFERVEGYADRIPKLPKNTQAPQNRRVEILLREVKR
jgi:chemotaxis protein MotB